MNALSIDFISRGLATLLPLTAWIVFNWWDSKTPGYEGPSRLRPFEFHSIKSNLAVACRSHFDHLNANHIEEKLLITIKGMGFHL